MLFCEFSVCNVCILGPVSSQYVLEHEKRNGALLLNNCEKNNENYNDRETYKNIKFIQQ
jgi:hypothetical protein